jgi:hypothetical protein
MRTAHNEYGATSAAATLLLFTLVCPESMRSKIDSATAAMTPRITAHHASTSLEGNMTRSSLALPVDARPVTEWKAVPILEVARSRAEDPAPAAPLSTPPPRPDSSVVGVMVPDTELGGVLGSCVEDEAVLIGDVRGALTTSASEEERGRVVSYSG